MGLNKTLGDHLLRTFELRDYIHIGIESWFLGNIDFRWLAGRAPQVAVDLREVAVVGFENLAHNYSFPSHHYSLSKAECCTAQLNQHRNCLLIANKNLQNSYRTCSFGQKIPKGK